MSAAANKNAGAARYWVLLDTPRGWVVMGTYDDLPESDIRNLRSAENYDVIDRSVPA